MTTDNLTEAPCSSVRHAWAPTRDGVVENLQWCRCKSRQWYDVEEREGQGYEIQVVVHWPARAPSIFVAKTKAEAIDRAWTVMETTDERPISINVRGRYVGEWEDVAAYQHGGNVVPRGFVVRYTNAPDNYFGFGTHVLGPTEYATPRFMSNDKRREHPFRKIAVDEKHETWQYDRNASGDYQTIDGATFAEWTNPDNGRIVP